MTNRTGRPSRGRALRVVVFAASALLSLCGAASAQWTQPDAQGNISNTNTGNVGIGTTTPGYPITIVRDQSGPASVATFNRADGAAAQASLGASRTLDWSNKYVSFGVTAPSFSTPGFSDTAYFHSAGVPLKFGSETANDILFFTNGINTTRMVITGAGNVGIGTTSPASLFHLSGATRPTLTISDSTGARARLFRTVGAQSDFAHNVTYDGTGWLLDDTASGGSSISLGATFIGINQWSAGSGYRPPTTPLYINSTGNIGMGTLAPAAKLHVGGQADNLFQVVSTGSAATDTVANFVSAAGSVLIVRGNGRVGIGTAAPASKLHVAGDITVDGNVNAKYQDVAEWVPSTQKLQAGTVVVLDTRNANHVAASTSAYDTRVAGVISAQPGISLGEAGEGKALVATTGRVKVRVDATRAPIQIGDLLVTSDVAGMAMRSEPINIGGRQIHAPGTIVGKALEPLAGGIGEILVLLTLQ